MKNTTEETLAVFRPAKRTAVPGAAIGVLAIIGAFVAPKFGEVGVMAAVVLALVGVSSLLWSGYRLLVAQVANRYKVTSTRLVARTGIFFVRTAAVRLEDVRGVSETRDFWGTLLGYSTLAVGTAATGTAEVVFKDIAGADEVVAFIDEVRD